MDVFDDEAAYTFWADKLFRPPRARLADVLAAPEPEDRAPRGLTPGAWRAWREVQREQLAREYWENLVTHGLVPPAWLADEGRAFRGTRAAHDPRRGETSTTYTAALLDHPPTPDAAIALASDIENVLVVEALADEACRRGTPYLHVYQQPRRTKRVVWDLSESGGWPQFSSSGWPYLLSSYLEVRVPAAPGAARERFDLWRFLGSRPPYVARWVECAVRAQRSSERFERAARAGERFAPDRNATYFAKGVVGRALAERDNPFAPIVEIFERGYAFEGPPSAADPVTLYAML